MLSSHAGSKLTWLMHQGPDYLGSNASSISLLADGPQVMYFTSACLQFFLCEVRITSHKLCEVIIINSIT